MERAAVEPSAIGRCVPRSERGFLALAWLFFFCVLGSYYVLRPIRDAFGVARGVQNLKWLYTGTFLAMLVLSPWFSALCSRRPPRTLVTRVLHFFALNLLAFHLLFVALPEEGRFQVGNAFFVWASVFNLFVVSVFWSFMADLSTPEQGKRFFGIVASGGSAGGFCGALATERLVERVGPEMLLLLSAALLELGVLCALCIARGARARGAGPGAQRVAPPERELPGFLAGAGSVLRSRYLLAICAFMLLTTICASIVYYQRGAIVAAELPSAEERARLFARMDRWAQLAIFLLQACAAGPLLARLGPGRTLGVLPLVYAVGFLALGLEPALSALIAFEVARRVIGFGVATPTREYLFTLVSPSEKYAAKNFVDTAVWRGGDLLGVLVADLLFLPGAGPAPISAGGLALCVAWGYVALRLGRRSARIAQHQAAPRIGTHSGTDP